MYLFLNVFTELPVILIMVEFDNDEAEINLSKVKLTDTEKIHVLNNEVYKAKIILNDIIEARVKEEKAMIKEIG